MGIELAIFHIRLIDTDRTSAEKLNRGQCATLLTRGISIVPPRPTDYLSFPPGLICQLSIYTSIASLWSSNECPFRIEMDTLCARVLIFFRLFWSITIFYQHFFFFFWDLRRTIEKKFDQKRLRTFIRYLSYNLRNIIRLIMDIKNYV